MMSETATFSIGKAEDGHLHVSGELSMASVPSFVEKAYFQDRGQAVADVHVDLHGVQRADSAGVALLLEWARLARAQNTQIHFHNVPAQMLAIAELSGVDALLGLS
jgi:phospholipid transport system transporter-binding protein